MTTQLTPEMIAAGKSFTERLDKIRFPIRAIFWMFLTEPNKWRLIISSPTVSNLGPRRAYQQIQNILAYGPPPKINLPLDDISLVETKHALVQLLSTAIGTDKGISAIRFSQNTINGQYIEDAYIYRLLR